MSAPRPTAADATRDPVAWATEELVRLVEIRSYPTQEHEIVAYLATRCAELDLPVRRLPVGGAADDLVIGWTVDPPELLLNAHVDTIVPTWDGSGRAEVRDGRVHGLGALDDKAGVVACLLAMVLARDAGAPLPSLPVAVGLTVDEEHGGTGSIAMAREVRPRRVVVAEGTDLGVGLTEAGTVEVHARTRGTPVHGALRAEATNALETAVRLAAELLDLPFTRAPAHPLLGANRVMLWELHGGTPLHVVPDAAELHVDVQVMPGTSAADVHAAIAQACHRADADLETVEVVEPFETPPDDPLAAGLAAAAHRVTGAEPPEFAMPAWTDAHNFVDVAGATVALFGPTNLRGAHHPEEFVEVADVLTCARVFADLLASPPA